VDIIRLWLKAWAVGPWVSNTVLGREADTSGGYLCGSVRVLVADDDPVIRLVLAARLESRGVVPLLAADGAEAVAVASELPFDLILMDLQMPILDGLKATSAIRRFESTSLRPAVPVVAHSSKAPDERFLTMHGMNGCLAKPCDDQDLEDCLTRWCPAYRSAPNVSGAMGDRKGQSLDRSRRKVGARLHALRR
jgi:CheY-like chemotaxis protein